MVFGPVVVQTGLCDEAGATHGAGVGTGVGVVHLVIYLNHYVITIILS